MSNWTIPDPLECDAVPGTAMPYAGRKFKIIPIGFATPKEDMFPCIGRKHFEFSRVDPRNRNTYVYGVHDEYEYKRHMSHSLFSYTKRKAGFDCQRHHEIISSTSLPYFEDIDAIPNHTMPFIPRTLLQQAKALADSVAVKFDEFGRPVSLDVTLSFMAKYSNLSCCYQQYSKKYLTSEFLARYVLKVTGHEHAKKVLFIIPTTSWKDYLTSALLHGLKHVLGPDNVVDYPQKAIYYEVPPYATAYESIQSQTTHGLGYTVTHRLHNYESVPRKLIDSDIRNKSYDLVIYNEVQRMHGLAGIENIQAIYGPEDIVLIDGDDYSSGSFMMEVDNQNVNGYNNNVNYHWKEMFHFGHYFKREIDKCPS